MPFIVQFSTCQELLEFINRVKWDHEKKNTDLYQEAMAAKAMTEMVGVLTDQPSGPWTLPAADTTVVQNSSSSSVDSLLDHIVNTSPLYNRLFDQKYVDITMEVGQLINEDWYTTSQIFAGAILVNETSALLLSCTEPYGRSKTVDAHHERIIGTAMNTSSSSKKQPNYGWINTITTHEDSATELKIGTTVSNLLVTSSVRIDKNSLTKNIVELGSTTSNFTATNDTKIYLNMDSLRLRKMLPNNQY